MVQGTAIIAGGSQNLAERVLGIRGAGFHFRVSFQGGDGVCNLTGFGVHIAESVQDRGKIRIDLQSRLHHRSRPIVVLLEIQPFRSQVKDMLVLRVVLQEVVHVHDRGKKVALLNAGHPADKELLVRRGTREKRFGFRQRRRIGNAAPGNEGKQRITQCRVRVLFRGMTGIHYCVVIH